MNYLRNLNRFLSLIIHIIFSIKNYDISLHLFGDELQ